MAGDKCQLQDFSRSIISTNGTLNHPAARPDENDLFPAIDLDQTYDPGLAAYGCCSENSMGDELIEGRYKVDHEIGRGGMGIVLRAVDTRLNRPVALKTIPPDAAHDPGSLRRLSNEARAASALNHVGIATVYDFIERGESSFIVYEYIEGHTLRCELGRNLFTTSEVVELGILLADALLAAHDHGVTHRDLKPDNIMLVPDGHSRGHVKILDFGLAKQRPLPAVSLNDANTISADTMPGMLVGTVSYMAPEQLECQPADARTDIYALGLVMYEMAAGSNPFVGTAPSSTIANILKEEPPSIRKSRPAVSQELDWIILKCLRKQPEQRYQSVRELLVDLRNVQQNQPSASITTAEPDRGILHRFFLLFGKTPQRRWAVMQIRMILWCLLLGYLGWRFMASNVGRTGLVLVLMEVGCSALLLMCISFLVFINALEPARLEDEAHRQAPWIRWSTICLVLVNWTMAINVVAEHPVLASLLALCGPAGGLKYTIFKGAIDRAAFPKL